MTLLTRPWKYALHGGEEKCRAYCKRRQLDFHDARNSVGQLRGRTRSHQLAQARLRLLISSDSVLFPFSRDRSHLLWHSLQSSELRHVGRIFDRHPRHIIDCSHFTQKQVFWTIVSRAPRVAKTVQASPTNTHNMSVAALFAASPVSTAVPSDAVSPDVSSLPSPVAQPQTRTPEELGSRLDKAFLDLVEKGCFFRYFWEDP